MRKNTIQEENTENSGVSRRRFLIGAGGVAGGLALAGTSLSGLTVGQQAGVKLASAATLNNDMDILQFALTLEHLEDAAYRAANASGLLSGTPAQLFKTFGDHEHQHVVALTDTITKLGGKPVAEQASYNFPKLTSQDQVISLFATIEEVGSGAYLGAAALIKDVNILAAALSIHNVEAEHTSTLKSYMNDPMPSPAFATPLTPDEVLAKVTPFLQAATPAPAGGYYTNTNPAPSLAVAVNRINAVNANGVTYFAETGHSLSGPFAAFYNAHGGLTVFGFPISEPFNGTNPTDGKTYVQQYYQRARLEWHPEYAGTNFEVEIGLLGAEQLFKNIMGG